MSDCERCGKWPLDERFLCRLTGDYVCRHCEERPGHDALHVLVEDFVLWLRNERPDHWDLTDSGEEIEDGLALGEIHYNILEPDVIWTTCTDLRGVKFLVEDGWQPAPIDNPPEPSTTG